MNAFGRLIAIIVCVILLLISPITWIYDSQNQRADETVYAQTVQFIDKVKEQGFFNIDMYENYLKSIAILGVYEVSMEHMEPVYGIQEIRQDSKEEIKPKTKKEIMQETKKDIKQETKKDNSLGAKEGYSLLTSSMVNSSTFISGFTKTEVKSNELVEDITTFSTHVHSDSCYPGTKHTHTGSSYSGTGCYAGGRYHSGSSYYCGTRTGSATVYDYRTTCSTCSTTFTGGSVYYRCTGCGNSFLGMVYSNGCRCGSYANYGYYYDHYNTTSSYYDLNCGKSAGTFYLDNGTLSQPMCNQIIVSVTPVNANQTVKQGESIHTTATVTYLDGSNKTVNCSTTFISSVIGDNQTAVLKYIGHNTANTTKTYEVTVNVTVKPNKQLASINVNMSSTTVRRYNNFPIKNVKLNFDDGTSTTVASGWTITGYDSTKLGNQTVTVSYTYESVIKSASVTIKVLPLAKTCAICGNIYELDQNDIDKGCPVCHSTIISISSNITYIKLKPSDPLNLVITAQYKDGHTAVITGWISDFDRTIIGEQVVTISYKGFTAHVVVFINDTITCSICGNEYLKNEDGSDPGCSYCKKTVESISVSPKIVTVNQGEELPITVTATFLDGHIEVVSGWTSNYDKNRIGTQNVSVYYGGSMDQITVHVVDSAALVTCPTCGLEYNPEENSYHCPVCFYTIEYIEAELKTGGNQVVIGSEPEFQVVVYFRDGHRELATSGITYTGYDSTKVGVQQVTVIYQGASCIFVLEVVNNLEKVICSNGHVYYLNADRSDPGCPFCMEGENTNKSIQYFNITYTSEIIEILYDTGSYELNTGDFISISVEVKEDITKQRSKGSSLFILWQSKRSKCTYGGRIV